MGVGALLTAALLTGAVLGLGAGVALTLLLTIGPRERARRAERAAELERERWRRWVDEARARREAV